MKVKAKRKFTALDENVDLETGDVLECTAERADYLAGIGFVEPCEKEQDDGGKRNGKAE